MFSLNFLVIDLCKGNAPLRSHQIAIGYGNVNIEKINFGYLTA